ncbi:MAG: nucleotidyltransferase family protein [Acidobacteriota bacterium]|nr:nucleotidyltransferase family protein [Acidobacteriota bacterium]
MQTDSIGVILLAAGVSARLGEPKQLLRFRGETLLRRSAKIALAASNRVIVTLGSQIEILRKEIKDLPVEIVENKDWATGMSGSIKVGLKKFLDDADKMKAIIVMVCDQPFVNENLLEKIITKFQETDLPIVACEYQNALGVPALFHKNLFPELLALDAQTGAKQLIKKYQAQTAAISFPEGTFDIDTPADYENLMENFK